MDLDSSAFVADPGLIRVLCRLATPVDCGEDRGLFHQGDEPTGFYILHSGEATMVLEDARGATVARIRLAPGSVLGLPAVLSNAAHFLTAAAKKGAKVSYLARDDFAKLMDEEPIQALTTQQDFAAEVSAVRLAMSRS